MRKRLPLVAVLAVCLILSSAVAARADDYGTLAKACLSAGYDYARDAYTINPTDLNYDAYLYAYYALHYAAADDYYNAYVNGYDAWYDADESYSQGGGDAAYYAAYYLYYGYIYAYYADQGS